MARSKVVLALVLIGLAGAGWWILGRGTETHVVDPGTDAGDDASADVDAAAALLRAGPRVRGGDPTATIASPYGIRGVVLDEAEKPVPGVVVHVQRNGIGRLFDPEDVSRWPSGREADPAAKSFADLDDPRADAGVDETNATTGVDGAFEVTVPSAGTYTARLAQTAGRVSSTAYAYVTVLVPVSHVTVRSAPGSELVGRVVDVGDVGVAGAVVSAVWTPSTDSSTRALGSAWDRTVVSAPVVTGANGAFVLPGVPDGKGTLTVRVPGRGTYAGFSATAPTKEEIVLRIGDGATVRGRITDTTGRIVVGADVMVSTTAARPPREGPRSTTLRATSSADGTYRIDGLVPGPVGSVIVMAAGFVALSQSPPSAPWSDAEGKAGAETTIDLVLLRGGSVKGRVLDASAKGSTSPVANAEVFLLGQASRGVSTPPPRVVAVDRDGAFRFDDVPLGKHHLYARSPSHYARPDPSAAPSMGPQWYGPVAPGGRAGLGTTVVVLSKDGEVFEKDLNLLRGIPVSGIVKGPDGIGVEGAKIRGPVDGFAQFAWQHGLTPQSEPTLATSGADGRFEIVGLAPTTACVLTPSKPPLAGVPSAAFAVGPGERTADVVLELVKGATLTGRVVDPSGGGVAGATVQTWMPDGSSRGYGTTGADGTFTLEGLGAGTMQVWASTSTGAQAQVPLDPPLKAGERRENIEIKVAAATIVAGGLLSGTVVDDEGAPVPQLQLHASGDGITTQAQTDVDGAFTFRGLSGSVRILRMGDGGAGWIPASQANPTYEAPYGNVRIVLPKRLRTVVAGRVVIPGGAACPLCTLSVRTNAGTATGPRRSGGSTDELVNGEFRLEVPANPPFDLVVTAARDTEGRPLNLRSKTVSVTEASTTLEIALEGGMEVRGRLVGPDDAPVAGATVRSASSFGQSLDDGSFRIVGLEGEEVSLSVIAPSRYVAPPQPVKVKPGATDVVIRLERGLAIAGRVVDETGAPVRQASVSVQGGRGGGSDSRGVQLDASGAFRIEGLPTDGSYTVTVQVWNMTGTSSYKPAIRSDVKAGTEDLVFRLETGEVIEGTVLDADGKPVARVWVQAQREGRPGSGAQVDTSGRFTIRGLEPGEYTIQAMMQSSSPRSASPVTARAGARDVRLVFARAVSVTGRLTGEGDRQGFIVVARTMKDGTVTGHVGSAQTASDGTFTIEVPADATFDLVAQKQDDDRYAIVPGVRAGAPGVSARLEAGRSIEGSLDDADGNRVAGSAWVLARTPSWTSYGMVDGNGKFALRGLPPGRYSLTVSSNNGAKSEEAGEADAGATGLRLRLSK